MIITNNAINLTIDPKIDLTSETTVAIGYRKPDGTEGEWSGTKQDNLIEVSITNEIDEDGMWSVWSLVDGIKGEEISIKVFDVPSEEWLTLSYVKALFPRSNDTLTQAFIPVVIADIERITMLKQEYFKDYWKPIAAAMVSHKLNNLSKGDDNSNVLSFRLGDYSVAYSDTQTLDGGYPSDLVKSLNPATVRFI